MARKHYKYDRRKLRTRNDPAVQEASKKQDGGYSVYRIEIVPLRDIKVPAVWNPGRLSQALEHMRKGTPLDPIEATKIGSKWEISDGIHRTNASIEMGYTHIPVLTSDWIETPNELVPEEPEKQQLSLGAWVKMRKPYEGLTYGWVDEVLGPRRWRGVKRYWYSIALVDQRTDWPNFIDANDTEFDPTRPPSWGPVRKQVIETPKKGSYTYERT